MDRVLESAGKKNSFPWNPVDKGWAWDASIAVLRPFSLGEETRGMSAGPGSTDLTFHYQS